MEYINQLCLTKIACSSKQNEEDSFGIMCIFQNRDNNEGNWIIFRPSIHSTLN